MEWNCTGDGHLRNNEPTKALTVLEQLASPDNRCWHSRFEHRYCIALECLMKRLNYTKWPHADTKTCSAICHLTNSAFVLDDTVSGQWYEFLKVAIWQRENHELFNDFEIVSDPWQHLIQAGVCADWRTDQAEAEIALAVEAAQNDPDVFLAIANLQQEWDFLAQNVEESWGRAIAAAGNDPIPLIKRGRWYFERGENEKAEADFARAAELTPNELYKFLEAAGGWWALSSRACGVLSANSISIQQLPSISSIR